MNKWNNKNGGKWRKKKEKDWNAWKYRKWLGIADEAVPNPTDGLTLRPRFWGTSWCTMLLWLFFCRSSFPVQSPHVLPNWSGGHLPRCVVLKVISYRPSSTSPRVSTMALAYWTRRLPPFLHSQGISPPFQTVQTETVPTGKQQFLSPLLTESAKGSEGPVPKWVLESVSGLTQPLNPSLPT